MADDALMVLKPGDALHSSYMDEIERLQETILESPLGVKGSMEMAAIALGLLIYSARNEPSEKVMLTQSLRSHIQMYAATGGKPTS